MKTTLPTAEQLRLDWTNNPRWAGVERPYSADDVVRLRGTIPIDHSIARMSAALSRRTSAGALSYG